MVCGGLTEFVWFRAVAEHESRWLYGSSERRVRPFHPPASLRGYQIDRWCAITRIIKDSTTHLDLHLSHRDSFSWRFFPYSSQNRFSLGFSRRPNLAPPTYPRVRVSL